MKRSKSTRRRRSSRRRQLPGRTTAGTAALPASVNTRAAEARQVEALRAELERLAGNSGPPRWNANPEDVRRSVVKLVLTLVELIRQLLERQAVRRMENGTLSPDEVEAVGQALMRLEDTVRELATQFDLSPDDLNLDLGPIGRLM